MIELPKEKRIIGILKMYQLLPLQIIKGTLTNSEYPLLALKMYWLKVEVLENLEFFIGQKEWLILFANKTV